MIDIFNNDAFTATSIAAAVKKLPYRPTRLGPGGLALFDEKPINTTSIAIEQVNGQLALIPATPRGAPGDWIGNEKSKLISFVANHLRRNAKVMADEVQGVRVFGSESELASVEQKRDEKLQLLQAMHEVTWEYHRMGALIGKVLDADGTTELVDVFAAFGVTQQVQDFALTTSTTDVRALFEAVQDLIDEELGAATYDHIHVLAGGTFYDDMIKHKYVQDGLKAQLGARMFDDLRAGFSIGGVIVERAKRWSIKNHLGAMIEMIPASVAYAFPVGAMTPEGNPFIGRFAPQPFLDTVNRLNPPLVVKTVVDPAMQFINLIGISCPLYLNTRPRAVVRLTKS